MAMLKYVGGWVKAHKLLFVVAGLGFAGGWLAHRPKTQVRTVETTKTVEVHHETQVVQQKVDLTEIRQLLAETSRKNNVTVIRETVKAPDGTVTTRERTEDRSETDSVKKSSGTTTVDAVTKSSTVVQDTKTTQHSLVTEPLRPPDAWGLAAMAGLGVPALWGRSLPSYVPGLPPAVVLGLTVDRRLVGPLRVGVWATSRLDVGLLLRVTF